MIGKMMIDSFILILVRKSILVESYLFIIYLLNLYWDMAGRNHNFD